MTLSQAQIDEIRRLRDQLQGKEDVRIAGFIQNALRQREPREVEADYKAWVATLPCAACLVMGKVRRGVHVAHVRLTDAAAGWRGAGMQEKPHDRRTTPLCPGHHQHWPNSQHKVGDERKWWFEMVRIDVFLLCADLSAAFDAGEPGYPVLARHAGRARSVEARP